jgi:hypothetical protein
VSSRWALVALSACLACGSSSGTDAALPSDAVPPPRDAQECPTSGPTVGDMPNDVAAVFIAVCQPCHTSPPQNRAPWPLMSYEDLVTPFGTTTMLRWQRIAQVIHPPNLPHMPPLTNTQPSADQLATLDAWFAQCAPPVPEGTGGDNGP